MILTSCLFLLIWVTKGKETNGFIMGEENNYGYRSDKNRGNERSGNRGRGRGNGRGNGRGRGQNFRYKSYGGDKYQHDDTRNISKDNNDTSASNIQRVGNNSIEKDNEEILRKRRERFEKDAKKEKENNSASRYGLISRGDDMTLKNSKNARIELYNDTKIRIKEYIFKEKEMQKDSERDSILMSLRKLRESIVAVNEENKHKKSICEDKEEDLKFYRDVYIESIRFGVEYGPYDSYVPAIQWILPIALCNKWKFTPSEKKWIVVQAVTQLAIREKRYEESFVLLNQYLGYSIVDLNSCTATPPSSTSTSTSVPAMYLRVAELLNAEGLLREQQKSLSYRGSEKTSDF